MIVRAIDPVTRAWYFGKGLNDYRRTTDAIVQSIDTRLSSFVGGCFFDLGAGINWFYLLGAKDQISLNLAISTVILNTPNVTGILQLSTSLNDVTRAFTVQYQVQTTYSAASATFTFDTTVG